MRNKRAKPTHPEIGPPLRRTGNQISRLAAGLYLLGISAATESTPIIWIFSRLICSVQRLFRVLAGHSTQTSSSPAKAGDQPATPPEDRYLKYRVLPVATHVRLIGARPVANVSDFRCHWAFGKAKELLTFPWGEHPIAPARDFDLQLLPDEKQRTDQILPIIG